MKLFNLTHKPMKTLFKIFVLLVAFLSFQCSGSNDEVITQPMLDAKKTEIINHNVYKIPNKIKNHSGIQIKLYLNQNKVEFTADKTFKKTLETIVSKENHRNHKFYCCKSNDATQLIETLDLNLYELLTQDSVQINVNAEANMDIYCRKIFDYSIERIHA
jgi:hypothetical protein